MTDRKRIGARAGTRVRRSAPSIVGHTHDDDCTLDADDTCTVCGVWHGSPCEACGGRGFHLSSCEAPHEEHVTRELARAALGHRPSAAAWRRGS